MYLEKRTYIGNNYRTPKARVTLKVPSVATQKKEGALFPVLPSIIKPERLTHVVEQVAYWRKANQIHDWLVRNCGDGDKDSDLYVDGDKLKELVETCRDVLAASRLVKGQIQNGYRFENGKEEPIVEDGEYIEDATLAKELLPNSKGFFFGSQEYDQYYVDDLKETIKQLEPLIVEGGDYYYVSSY